MADQLILESPFGTLAFTPDQVREAVARANDMVLALGLARQDTSTPSKEEQETQWLSIDEVAQRTGLKKSWLYEEVRNNRIPRHHFGRQVRIPSSYLTNRL